MTASMATISLFSQYVIRLLQLFCYSHFCHDTIVMCVEMCQSKQLTWPSGEITKCRASYIIAYNEATMRPYKDMLHVTSNTIIVSSKKYPDI